MSKEQKFTNQPRVKVTEKIMNSSHDKCTLATKQKKVLIAVDDKIISNITLESEIVTIKYTYSKPWELRVYIIEDKMSNNGTNNI